MDALELFHKEKEERIEGFAKNEQLKSTAAKWLQESMQSKYVYNFSWLGIPIIQNPQDILATQEIIWEVKPDLIIETGIAHGGSLVLSSSILELLEASGKVNNSKVLGIDIDIRKHNYDAITNHPMSKRITMFQGSSIDQDIIEKVYDFAKQARNILIFLDSNHTHQHVLAELNAYAPLVSLGSYCVVFDSFIEDLPKGFFNDKPWDVGNNPKTAIWEFLKTNDKFEMDKKIENKILATAAPDGFLKRVK